MYDKKKNMSTKIQLLDSILCAYTWSNSVHGREIQLKPVFSINGGIK